MRAHAPSSSLAPPRCVAGWRWCGTAKRPFAVSWKAARAGSCSRGQGEPARWCPASGAAQAHAAAIPTLTPSPTTQPQNLATTTHNQQSAPNKKARKDLSIAGSCSSSCHQSDLNKRPINNQPEAAHHRLSTRSKMPAAPWPVPIHIVTMPYLPPVRRRPCTTVAARMAPVAPRGWPRAIAPPIGFTLARSSTWPLLSRSLRIGVLTA